LTKQFGDERRCANAHDHHAVPTYGLHYALAGYGCLVAFANRRAKTKGRVRSCKNCLGSPTYDGGPFAWTEMQNWRREPKPLPKLDVGGPYPSFVHTAKKAPLIQRGLFIYVC